MIKLNILGRVDELMTVVDIVRVSCPTSWRSTFDEAEYELALVSRILEEEKSWYPMKRDLFNAFKWTPLNEVKVVLIGQDPYHDMLLDEPKARGLSFSVSRRDNIPSSLRNVYKELERSVEGYIKPNHGCLELWASRGVLLLNTCLTVRAGQPGSHCKIWNGFIRVVLNNICRVNPRCIFLLWGMEAQKLKTVIPNSARILEAGHPSGMNRNNTFIGCDHFNKVNELLHPDKIDWTL